MITRTERQNKESRMKRSHQVTRLSALGGILLIVLLMLAVAILLLLIRGKLEGSAPRLAGYSFYAASGGKMLPDLPDGSLVMAKPVSLDHLSVNDLIVFQSSGDQRNYYAEKIVDIDSEHGFLYLESSGDSVAAGTDPITGANYLGKVTGAITLAGYILDFIQQRAGIVLLVIVPSLLIIFLELRKISRYVAAKNNTFADENDSMNTDRST